MAGFWRIRVGNEDVLRNCIREGCVAVGWGEIDDLCNRDKEWLRNKLRELNKSIVNGIRQIEGFCAISPDDRIILYRRGSIWATGEVTGEYYHEKSQEFVGDIQYKSITKRVQFYNKKKVNWTNVYEPPVRVIDLNTLQPEVRNKSNLMLTIVKLTALEWNDIQSSLP